MKTIKITKDMLENMTYDFNIKNESATPKYFCMECGETIYEDDDNCCFNICNNCRNSVC